MTNNNPTESCCGICANCVPQIDGGSGFNNCAEAHAAQMVEDKAAMNNNLTDEHGTKFDFQALREAAEKATPGPWRAFRYDSGICGVSGGESFEILVCERISSNRPEDAKFIAVAHPAAVLALLDELAVKDAEPELKMANLINKFYERYPLETFKSDSERSEALGYFMAGAELQCFGEFVKYEDLCGDE